MLQFPQKINDTNELYKLPSLEIVPKY